MGSCGATIHFAFEDTAMPLKDNPRVVTGEYVEAEFEMAGRTSTYLGEEPKEPHSSKSGRQVYEEVTSTLCCY